MPDVSLDLLRLRDMARGIACLAGEARDPHAVSGDELAAFLSLAADELDRIFVRLYPQAA